MVKYFPFIYEKLKKRKKDLPEQIPLYIDIEEYIPIFEEKSKEKEDQSNIEVIELF
jgi:hypothetical protein